MDIQLPSELEEFATNPRRINILEGGRGGAKSHSVADLFLLWGMEKKERFVCLREVQESIEQSVYRLLVDKITEHNYPYMVFSNKIVCPLTETEFYFHGLSGRTAVNIKSFEGATWAWVEEGQTVSKKSLDILIPTIRKEGSKIVFTLNREEPDPGEPVIAEFCQFPSPDVLHIYITYKDNPFLPDTLLAEVKRCIEKSRRTGDWSDYNHIWLGKPLTRKSKIFNNYRVKDFTELEKTFDNYREGLDWGFATDPLAWSVQHFDRKRLRLYICDELYLYGHSNALAFEKIKAKTRGARIIADSSEPKSISEAQNSGVYIAGAKKGQGSVEHGIKFMQSLEIIIHPRCTNTKIEFDKYRYKEDKLGNVLPEPVDKFNHLIDEIRYSLEDDSIGENEHSFFS